MNDQTGPHGLDPEEQRLRRLLDDAVSDIEPRDALGPIHARTKVSSMQSRRSWLLGAGAAVVATAATVVAVTLLAGDGTTNDPGFAGPSPSGGTSPSEAAEPSPSSPSQTPVVEAVPVYYVGDTTRGPRLYREFHQVATGGDALAAAVTEALRTRPDDPDYRSPWPGGTGLGEASYDGDVVTVSLEPPDRTEPEVTLRDRPQGMSEQEAAAAVEQLVYTAQAALQQGRPPVQFLINGQRTDMLLGVPVSEPVSEGDAVEVLAQVWVIEPAEGAEVTAPFEVSGLAAAFEATVEWELRQGDRVVMKDFTTAEECCTMAPYTFTVDAPPGEYTLVVHDSDPSGGEGPGPWEDTKRVVVLP